MNSLYFLVDVETTGLDQASCEIWSVAAKVFNIKDLKIEILGDFYDVNRNIEPKKIHSLEEKNIKEIIKKGRSGSEQQLLSDFYTFCAKQKIKYMPKKIMLIGYNVSFDKGFLDYRCEKYNLDIKSIFSYHYIDVMQIYMFYLLTKGVDLYDEKLNLKSAMNRILKEESKNYIYHDALEDVNATFKLFETLFNAKR